MLNSQDRARLRTALRDRHPWLDETEIGPRSVEAGECDRCGAEARMVETCGPIPWAALGRTCTAEIGADAWCDGHKERGAGWRQWLGRLPPDADAVARLWWVATGEVRLDPSLLTDLIRMGLPEASDLPDQRG